MSAPSENNKKPTHTTQEKGKWVARNNNGQINDTQETNDDYLNKILFHVDDDQDLGQEVVKEDQAGSSNAVDSDMTKKYRSEIDEAKAYFLRNVRPSTVAAYMPCVEAWMDYCDTDRFFYDEDGDYCYTVGPPEMVMGFFIDVVFEKTVEKKIAMNEDARVSLPSPSATATQVLSDAPEVETKKGKKKVVESPASYETVNQYRKSLMLLYRCQNVNRKTPWPSPKTTKDLLVAMKKYKSDLVYGHLQQNPNRAVTCVLRNAYKPSDLIRMLKGVWMSDTKTSMRDLFSLSSRHQMLLRDQDIRNLRFSDCFHSTIQQRLAGGKQQAVGVVFCLTEGKNVEPGELRYSCAIRHANPHRCAVSAFAFHLYSILQSSGSFLNDKNWSFYKVVRGRNSPTESISKSQQYTVTSEIFRRYGIKTSRVTHGGRHAAVIEGQNLNIPIDVIKSGGGWKDRRTRLETHYIDNQPSQWAKGIAGFWDKAFYLNRNCVNPPKDLQRAIFPWVEIAYGENNDEWKAECDREMNEPDENEDQDIAASDIMKISVEVIQETGQDQEKNQKSKNQKNLLPSQEPAKVYDEDDLAKRGFLKLLLRLRRVILQDAAVFLFERRTNKLVHDGEINQDGTINIFATIEFKRFQEELLSQLDNPVDDRLGEYENLVPELVDVQKEFTHRLAGIEGRMAWEQYENQKRHFELQNAMITQQNNMAISQQALHHHYQQILYNQGLLLQNQQILSSQLQMWLAANNFGQTSAPSASAMPTTPMPFIPPMPPTSQPFYPQLSIVQQNFRPPLPPAPIQNLSFSRVHPPTPPSIPSPASISRPLDFVGDLPSSSSSPRPPLSLSVSHSTPTPPTPPPAKKSREKNGMWVVQNPQYKKK